MSSKDPQPRHKTISRWMGASAVVNYVNRTGDLDTAEKNPYWPLAIAILLDVTLGEKMIPTDKREAMA